MSDSILIDVSKYFNIEKETGKIKVVMNTAKNGQQQYFFKFKSNNIVKKFISLLIDSLEANGG